MIRAIATMFLLILAASSARADLAAGLEAMAKGDETTARQHLAPLAEAGEPRAAFAMGELALHRRSAAPDFAAAAQWYEKAALKGHAQAQLRLGALHALGMGASESAQRAYFWFIYAVVGADGPVRRDAMTALNGVARQLTPGQKADVARPAVDAWTRR